MKTARLVIGSAPVWSVIGSGPIRFVGGSGMYGVRLDLSNRYGQHRKEGVSRCGVLRENPGWVVISVRGVQVCRLGTNSGGAYGLVVSMGFVLSRLVVPERLGVGSRSWLALTQDV